MGNAPKHIAIIMDGNRRWAKKRKLMPWDGHNAGRETLLKLTKEWMESETEYLTLYAFSLKNLEKRNPIEKKYLYDVFKKGMVDVLNDPFFFKNMKFGVIGRWDQLPDKELKKKLQNMIDKTKDNKGKYLTLAVCYDGQDEMVYAMENILKQGITKITPEIIKENMFTKNLPPVDMIIRTGGDKRVSGFLLWDASYAEMYFIDTLFPDSVPGVLNEAINEFKNRKRRYGK